MNNSDYLHDLETRLRHIRADLVLHVGDLVAATHKSRKTATRASIQKSLDELGRVNRELRDRALAIDAEELRARERNGRSAANPQIAAALSINAVRGRRWEE